MRSRHFLHLCFIAWKRDTQYETRTRSNANWNSKMEKVTSRIISEYETELQKVTGAKCQT
jgi:hypothetical protein